MLRIFSANSCLCNNNQIKNNAPFAHHITVFSHACFSVHRPKQGKDGDTQDCNFKDRNEETYHCHSQKSHHCEKKREERQI